MKGLGRKSVPPGVAAVPTLLVCLLLAGCGTFFVGFVSNPQIPSSSISGRVTASVLASVNDQNGNPLTITIVTFTNGGLSSPANFCGDQRPRFPINNVVRADFNPGNECLFLVNVVIIN